MTVSTKLTKDELRVAAQRAGLTPTEFDGMTYQIFEAGISITSYPGNPKNEPATRFLRTLVEDGRAIRRD